MGWVVRELAMQRAIRYASITSCPPKKTIQVTSTIAELKAARIPMVADVLNDAEVAAFAEKAEYEFYYPDYYRGRDLMRLKKIREHFMAARLLNLQKEDIYLDVASQSSPAPAVYEWLFGCRVLRQDLQYPPGRHGRVIGGSAGHMPLEDGSVTKMALHCSLEHFEGDEDIAFIREASRVLVPEGRLVIVPLYLSDEYFVYTQPSLWAHLPQEQWPVFPKDAVVYASKANRNRHERYYDARHFIERLVKNSTVMQVTVLSFGGAEVYAPGQMRFAAVFEKVE